jgi:hypothetical protein
VSEVENVLRDQNIELLIFLFTIPCMHHVALAECSAIVESIPFPLSPFVQLALPFDFEVAPPARIYSRTLPWTFFQFITLQVR